MWTGDWTARTRSSFSKIAAALWHSSMSLCAKLSLRQYAASIEDASSSSRLQSRLPPPPRGVYPVLGAVERARKRASICCADAFSPIAAS